MKRKEKKGERRNLSCHTWNPYIKDWIKSSDKKKYSRFLVIHTENSSYDETRRWKKLALRWQSNFICVVRHFSDRSAHPAILKFMKISSARHSSLSFYSQRKKRKQIIPSLASVFDGEISIRYSTLVHRLLSNLYARNIQKSSFLLEQTVKRNVRFH